jgi:hypothetical protein
LRAGISRCAEADGCGFVRIAQQVIGKVELLLERPVGVDGVEADAQNGAILVIKVLDSITEPVAFDGSAGGIGFGIPPHQDIAAGKVGERDRLPILVGHGEGGGRLTGCDHGHIPPRDFR